MKPPVRAGPAPACHCCEELSDDAALPQNAHRFSRSFLPCTATASPPSSPKTTGIAELIFLACRTIGLRIPGGSLPLRLRRYKCQPKPRHYLHSSGFCRNRTRSRTDSACRPQKSRRRDGKNHSSGNDRSARIVAKKSVFYFRT